MKKRGEEEEKGEGEGEGKKERGEGRGEEGNRIEAFELVFFCCKGNCERNNPITHRTCSPTIDWSTR